MSLLQAGVHQLIMQQTYAQLPFNPQQLGLPSAWLAQASGAAAQQPGGSLNPALPSFEAVTAIQQQVGHDNDRLILHSQHC